MTASESDGKNFFLENLKNARTTIDKEMLVLSTAALGFSGYFVQGIGLTVSSMHIAVLVAACWAFGFAIISTLISHDTCARHCMCAVDYVNGGSQDKKLYKKAMRWNCITAFFNSCSLFLVSSGIILFLVYASLTLWV